MSEQEYVLTGEEFAELYDIIKEVQAISKKHGDLWMKIFSKNNLRRHMEKIKNDG